MISELSCRTFTNLWFYIALKWSSCQWSSLAAVFVCSSTKTDASHQVTKFSLRWYHLSKLHLGAILLFLTRPIPASVIQSITGFCSYLHWFHGVIYWIYLHYDTYCMCIWYWFIFPFGGMNWTSTATKLPCLWFLVQFLYVPCFYPLNHS